MNKAIQTVKLQLRAKEGIEVFRPNLAELLIARFLILL